MLATIEQVAARAGEPIETPDEKQLAQAVLEYASEQALLYGKSSWTRESCPGVVRAVVVEAAARGYQHPSGLETERADSVTFTVHEDWLRGAEFTDEQVAIVRRAAQRKGRIMSLTSSRTNRYRSRAEAHNHPWFMKTPYVPSEGVPFGTGRLDAFAFRPEVPEGEAW